jgi:hypothetical protein
MTKLISSWLAVLLLYVASVSFLFIGSATGAMWPLAAAVIMFTVWDFIWILCRDGDRNAQEMLDSSTRARTYMSYFVAIYGTGIFFILRLSSEPDRAAALLLLDKSGVPGWLLIAPFILCAVAMLFFPIKMGEGTNTPLAQRQPTDANIAIVILCAWIQKVATYTFVYCAMLIAAYVWSGATAQKSDSPAAVSMGGPTAPVAPQSKPSHTDVGKSSDQGK